MNIHITGRHMETGAALQRKTASPPADINVTFSKQENCPCASR